MALTSDTLLERLHLKRQIHLWRISTLSLVALFALYNVENSQDISPVSGSHIARFTIEGEVSDSIDRDELLEHIAENDAIKAVVLRIDSPGGTAVAGESISARIKQIAKKKPVVAVCRTMCTSAGYMIAVSAPYIVAQESSITGSVGVVLQSFEASNLAEKIGITPLNFKSGINKSAPSQTEKLLPEQQVVIQGVIDDFFSSFLAMVTKDRSLKDDAVATIKDGRIFTGSQALKLGLIDKIGGEQEALAWLRKEKNIDASLDVRDVEMPDEDKSLLEALTSWSGLHFLSSNVRNRLDGLLLIWQPSGLSLK